MIQFRILQTEMHKTIILLIVLYRPCSMGHCHHSMVCPWVAVGGGILHIWRAGANILNMQLQTANKGWSSSLGVGRWVNNSSP
jgi:hypothetical protein